MDRLVLALCGIWVWMTRRRRIAAYISAAKTLEFAHGHLLRDFTSRASTSDRGTLLPHQTEALSLLEGHAIETYFAATRLSNFVACCSFVAEDLRLRTNTSKPAVVTQPTPATVPAAVIPILTTAPKPIFLRVRYRLPRLADLPAFARRFLRAETSGTVWQRESSESEAPLKAA